MTFYALSSREIYIFATIISILISAIISINNYVQAYLVLPEVYTNNQGACIKVVNYENGHAFNCNDVNVILRKYRKVSVTENEK